MELLPLLCLALLLVLVNGFFVATEFALVRMRPSHLQSLVEEGKPGALHALKMVQRLDAYLSATQFGITLASLGLGWLGEPAFARLIEPVAKALFPSTDVRPIAHTVAVVVAFGLITLLHIVFWGLGPKNLAIQKNDRLAPALRLPIPALFVLLF